MGKVIKPKPFRVKRRGPPVLGIDLPGTGLDLALEQGWGRARWC